MHDNNVMGIILSNTPEELIQTITSKRTLGSTPFGARYRLIDFPLSNMVTSGITNVGIITKQNYKSLIEHLGSGKPWGLSRKHNRLFFLPLFGRNHLDFTNTIEALYAISGFLESSKEEYILLTGCNVICNINYQNVINQHYQKNADITIVYKKDAILNQPRNTLAISLNNQAKVTNIRAVDSNDMCNCDLDMLLIRRKLLINLVSNSIANNKTSFKHDIIQKYFAKYRVYGYEHTGYARIITSIEEYFNANMELQSNEIRSMLFNIDKPIYTNTLDKMPTIYGVDSSTNNCIVANGSVINGKVSNCIISTGVKISAQSIVSNCILMQNTVINQGCNLHYVICDRNVNITPNRSLTGSPSCPMYIKEASIL